MKLVLSRLLPCKTSWQIKQNYGRACELEGTGSPARGRRVLDNGRISWGEVSIDTAAFVRTARSFKGPTSTVGDGIQGVLAWWI